MTENNTDNPEWFTNTSNLRIYCKYWKPENNPRALVLIAHGYAEHCGRAEIVANIFAEMGFLVFSHDHVGHGKSEGNRCDVSSYEVYIQDLLQHIHIMQTKYLSMPLFLYGHSMGGALSLILAQRSPELFKGVILSSPMINKNIAFNSSIKIALMKWISPVIPFFPVAYLDTSLLSRDQNAINQYKSDPLVYNGPVKMRMAYQLYLLSEAVNAILAKVQFPFLVLHGDHDGLCDFSGSQKLIEMAQSSDKTLKVFKGGFHELFNEIDEIPKKFLDDIKDWLNTRIK